jgi:hypothetical protein
MLKSKAQEFAHLSTITPKRLDQILDALSWDFKHCGGENGSFAVGDFAEYAPENYLSSIVQVLESSPLKVSFLEQNSKFGVPRGELFTIA